MVMRVLVVGGPMVVRMRVVDLPVGMSTVVPVRLREAFEFIALGAAPEPLFLDTELFKQSLYVGDEPGVGLPGLHGFESREAREFPTCFTSVLDFDDALVDFWFVGLHGFAAKSAACHMIEYNKSLHFYVTATKKIKSRTAPSRRGLRPTDKIALEPLAQHRRIRGLTLVA